MNLFGKLGDKVDAAFERATDLAETVSDKVEVVIDDTLDRLDRQRELRVDGFNVDQNFPLERLRSIVGNSDKFIELLSPKTCRKYWFILEEEVSKNIFRAIWVGDSLPYLPPHKRLGMTVIRTRDKLVLIPGWNNVAVTKGDNDE